MSSEREPQLKYSSLGGDAELILARQEASAFCASDKLHVLGCASGALHVLGFEGHKINKVSAHETAVTALALSGSLDQVASAAADGSIRVFDLHTGKEQWRLAAPAAVSCLAIPPAATAAIKELVVGTEAGHVLLYRKGIFGAGEVKVARGAGRIHSVVWTESGIVWASNAGCSACFASGAHVSQNAAQPPPSAGQHACRLVRVTPTTLLAAWPHALQVLDVRAVARQPGSASASFVGSVAGAAAAHAHMQITELHAFTVGYRLLGAAPFGERVALLADCREAACRPDTGRPPAGPATAEAEGVTEEESATLSTAALRPADGADAGDIKASSEDGQHVPQENSAAGDDAHSPAAPYSANGEAGGHDRQDADAPSALLAPQPCNSPDISAPQACNIPDLTAGDAAGTFEYYDRLQLRIVSLSGEELRHDRLDVEYGGSHQAHALVAWYPVQYGPLLTPDAPPLATPATPLRRGKSLALSEATTPVKPARATPASQQKAASKQEPANGAASPAATAGAHSAATPPRQADVPDAQSSFATAADAPPPPRSPPGLPAAEAARAPAPVRHASMASAAPEDKWWLDNDDPLYFVLTPSSITLGRPCDADDQVLWLIERRRYRQAMDAVLGAAYVRPETSAACSAAFLDHLVTTGQFAEAAAWAPRLLAGERNAWERLAFAFGQLEKLPLLARKVPTAAPPLSRTTYLMIVSSFLPRPELHAQLLDLLESWPSEVVTSVSDDAIDAVHAQLARAPQQPSVDLLRVLALLHRLQGDHERALDLSLRVSDEEVFSYVRKFHLYGEAARNAARLMNVDEDAAVALFVENHEAVAAAVVAADLRRLEAAARDGGAEGEVTVWRRRLFKYLDALFEKERRASHDLHDLQVELYATFAPERLLPFLQSSKQFHLDAALDVARAHGLIAEQVFILGRMSRTSEALRLIVAGLGDLPRAIAFVSAQDDDALWDELIALVTSDPNKASDLTGQLLDQIGGFVDPLRLVRAIPDGLRIPRLHARLASIIKRFRSSVLLKQRCNDIIEADCMLLAAQVLQASHQPLRRVYVRDGRGEGWHLYDTTTGALEACNGAPEVPSDAVSFCEPRHTLTAPPRQRAAAEVRARVAGGDADGWRALAAPQSQQAVEDLCAELAARAPQSTRMWSA